MIGKLKSKKYGMRILEEIENHSRLRPLDNDATNEVKNAGEKTPKRIKTSRPLVILESSGDEA